MNFIVAIFDNLVLFHKKKHWYVNATVKHRGCVVLLLWPSVVIQRLWGRIVVYRDVAECTVTHRSGSRATLVMHCSIVALLAHPWSIFSPNRVWSVTLPGIYERTRNLSRFAPVWWLKTVGTHRGVHQEVWTRLY